MGVFRFKKFEVCDNRSAMKVGTDGVLLGAVTKIPQRVDDDGLQVLDIGTGSGLVALMLSQKLDSTKGIYHIQGIDIDEGASADAAENFTKSPWSEHLDSMNMSLKSFAEAFPEAKFGLIVSNPPYYDNSLEAPEAKRNMARHVGDAGQESLSYREIIGYSKAHLSKGGFLWLILPADQENDLLRFSRMSGFSAGSILRIKSVQRKPPFRIIVSLGLMRMETTEGELVLLDEKGRRTAEHVSLTNDFYL